MTPTSHRRAAVGYQGRLVDLERSGFYSVGDIHARARIFGGDGQDALSVVLGEAGYFPNITASLGWFENNNPFPLSQVAFRVPFLMVKGYASWMNSIVSQYRELLDYVGITSSLEIYAHGHIP